MSNTRYRTKWILRAIVTLFTIALWWFAEVQSGYTATELAMFRRLASGDATGAVELALRRLRAAGLRPPLAVAIADPTTTRRWAAAIAFPIAPGVAAAMADRFESPSAQETA